ncbi:MAG: carbohydrate ABC transporter permease [Spirochaetia bacterium]|jgi:multiple sugar transport system permease protein
MTVNLARLKGATSKISLGTLTWLVVFIAVAPLLWFAEIAFKPQVLAWTMPPKFIFVPTFENFLEVFASGGRFLSAYMNSAIVSVFTTSISLFLGVSAGYALARSTFRFTRSMGIWIILTRMAPPMIFLLPFYTMLRILHLSGTYAGIIITYLVITLPFVTWMMSSYFHTIPEDIEQSAMIDGCNRLQILIRIAAPISLPAIVTCTIFSFIYSWNEFLFALVVTGRGTKTVPIMIQGFMSSEGIEWGPLAATSLMVILPVLIVALVNQRGFVRGLTGGALK